MVVERIIVLAKTYPELSTKHGPLVCVAGVNEYREWRRLYPIPAKIWVDKGDSRYSSIRFKKWDIIEVEVSEKPPQHDRREESRKVINWEGIKIVDKIESWEQRLTIIKQLLDPSIETLIKSGRSLGVIKPIRVEKFFAQPRQRLRSEAEKQVLEKMDQADATLTLLDYVQAGDEYLLPEVKKPDVKIERLPWIGYRFYCSPECNGHEMMVIDWEAQELFRKYRRVEGPVEQKLFHEFVYERDLYFIVGNTWRHHRSFMIIGLFYPPKDTKPVQPLQPIFKQKPRSKTLFDFSPVRV
jgi:hypothetical protein